MTTNKSYGLGRSEDFNFGWIFSKNNVPESASQIEYNEAGWRNVRLPHDWSAEESFTQENTAPETASLPGGIGWYRKTFFVGEDTSDKLISVEFDGVYTNAEVWINGHYLGQRPYGYIPFSYDLTPYLNYGDKKNVIVVKADRSSFLDCRWYPGSGIYRNVKLVTTEKVHVPQYGMFVTTPEVSEEKATVSVKVTILNGTGTAGSFSVAIQIVGACGEVINAEDSVADLSVQETKEIEICCDVLSPKLWSTDEPNLYNAIVSIEQGDAVVDTVSTRFGIRSFEYDNEKGFFLNGVNTLFKGVCIHSDAGCLGTAIPDDVWRRRLQILKECGVNAIRAAHNPPSVEFLDLCDEMGFLVQDESFDEFNNPKDKRHNFHLQGDLPAECEGYTDVFSEESERDVKAMVLRDRNHPSIVMWSVGNEIEWTYPVYQDAAGYWDESNDASYYYTEPPHDPDKIQKMFDEGEHGPHDLAKTAQDLSRWVKEIDTTRPVTANLVIPSVSYLSGYTDALDIVGLSYRQVVYNYCKEHYGDKPMLGTENWAHWHEWKAVLENEHVPGIFLWTGINYLGESHNWPVKGYDAGLIDYAGFPQASYHMFKTLWQDDSHVYMTTKKLADSAYQWNDDRTEVICKEDHEWNKRQWWWQPVEHHWNYEAGEEIAVEIYTNAPLGELFLNGESCGRVALEDCEDRTLKWIIPFAEGELVAKAYNAYGSVTEHVIKTAAEASQIEMNCDKKSISANFYDVAHIELQLKDTDGNVVEVDDQYVTFYVDGDCRYLGVDHGGGEITNDNLSEKCKTRNGRCLLILQANDKPGIVKVTASLENGTKETISFEIK